MLNHGKDRLQFSAYLDVPIHFFADELGGFKGYWSFPSG